jgi:formylglycine-generating enzyme required for sulfatase activity
MFAGGACEAPSRGRNEGPEAGGVPVPTDGGAPLDAAPDVVATRPPPDASPPSEIIIQAPGGAFAIDSREVTVAQFAQFLASTRADAGAVKGCEWKTSLGPAPGCTPSRPGDGDQPITCVDWCDAQAYCESRGKRLCARVGGSSVPSDLRLDPLADEWSRACGGPITADRWPYGTDAGALRCNTKERDAGTTELPGTLSGCEGAPASLFDMSGNVAEWEDSCTGTVCAVRGGSYEETTELAKCSRVVELDRATASPTIGVRCCKDLQQ